MNDINKIKLFVFPVIFGIIWGLFEMLVGSYLHIVQFPLRGALMSGCGVVFMCILRERVNRFGVNFYAGIVAIIVKLFSYGGFKLGPVIGIFIEVLLIELSFFIFSFNKFSILLSSFLSVLEGIPHFFITTWLMYGGGIFDVYINAMNNISKLFGFDKKIYLYVLSIWIFAHFIIGFISFVISFKIIKWLRDEI